MAERPWIHICSLCGRVRMEYAETESDAMVWHKGSHGYCPDCAQRVKAGFPQIPLAMLIDRFRFPEEHQQLPGLRQEVLERLVELQGTRQNMISAQRNASARLRRIRELEAELRKVRRDHE